MGRSSEGHQHGGGSSAEEVISEQFMSLNYDELGHLDWLIRNRKISGSNLSYLLEWATTGDKWHATGTEIIVWLETMRR